MKKSLYLGLIACAATMVSCSNDDVLTSMPASDNAIAFSTYTGKAQSRATTLTSDNLTSFGVFAFYTEQTIWTEYEGKSTPNFMNNEQVTRTITKNDDGSVTASNWQYSPIKYWPNNPNDMVTFFAYAPYDANAKWSESGTTINYSQKDNEDLLYTELASTDDLTKKNIVDKVEFKFKHALSKVDLQVAYTNDKVEYGSEALASETNITVQKVTITPADGTTQFTASQDFDMNTEKWANNIVAYTAVNVDESFTWEYAEMVKTVADKVTNEYQKLNTDEKDLMMIPQDLQTAKLKVTIDYTVTTTDSKLNGGKSEIKNSISNDVAINFEQGKYYTLRLLLGMTSVKVAAEVAPWVVGNATVDYDLPKNEAAPAEPGA